MRHLIAGFPKGREGRDRDLGYKAFYTALTVRYLIAWLDKGVEGRDRGRGRRGID